MGLVQQIEDALLNKLSALFQPILGPLNRLWSAIKSFFTALVQLIPHTITLWKLVLAEIQAWRTFKENLNFKTGVVNLQSARDRIETLIQEFIDSWHAIVSLWTAGKINPLEQITEASTALADLIESFGKIGRFTEFLKDFGPKLERAGGKVFEVLAIIQAIAETLLEFVDKLTTIVNTIRDARETFQTGEGLFLPQKNARKRLKLADGGSIKVRLGKLHS